MPCLSSLTVSRCHRRKCRQQWVRRCLLLAYRPPPRRYHLASITRRAVQSRCGGTGVACHDTLPCLLPPSLTRSHMRRCRLHLSCHVLVSSFRTRTSCMSPSRGRTVKSSIYMDGPPHRQVMCMYVWQYVHTLHVMHNNLQSTCHIHTQINRRDACSSTLSRNCRREESYIVDAASESRL